MILRVMFAFSTNDGSYELKRNHSEVQMMS